MIIRQCSSQVPLSFSWGSIDPEHAEGCTVRTGSHWMPLSRCLVAKEDATLDFGTPPRRATKTPVLDDNPTSIFHQHQPGTGRIRSNLYRVTRYTFVSLSVAEGSCRRTAEAHNAKSVGTNVTLPSSLPPPPPLRSHAAQLKSLRKHKVHSQCLPWCNRSSRRWRRS